MKQPMWSRIIHSGDWCLRMALRTPGGACQKWTNYYSIKNHSRPTTTPILSITDSSGGLHISRPRRLTADRGHVREAVLGHAEHSVLVGTVDQSTAGSPVSPWHIGNSHVYQTYTIHRLHQHSHGREEIQTTEGLGEGNGGEGMLSTTIYNRYWPQNWQKLWHRSPRLQTQPVPYWVVAILQI